MSTIDENPIGTIIPKSCTLLIIDDESANLATVTKYLRTHDFNIKVSQTGKTGLKLARQAQPDLILLDVRLPDIDGFEVCRRLKADEKTQEIPVIFMTIMTRVEDKVAGFKAGGVDYITKPFQHEEVLARVTTHLRLRFLAQNLEKMNANLEQRVQERTSALAQANTRLKKEIVERKKVEEKVRTLNQELEQRVADRTIQLESAIKELESFTYSVSHDLRVPLRHIEGFIERLRDRLQPSLDEKSLHYMEVIAYSAKRMGKLIYDLLSFSQMGQQEMSKQQIDLEKLIREVIEELKPEIKSRNITWKIGDFPRVTGDYALLKVVFINLITNAMKFTSTREQAGIEIGCKRVSETEATIFVHDNGVGFDMNYVDKLFVVFQRLHHIDEFEGTGIGLASVQRIINRHGGKTWAEGKVDEGATFYFSLPLSTKSQHDVS